MSSTKLNMEVLVVETEEFVRRQRRIAEEFLTATDEYLERLQKIRSQSGNEINNGFDISTLDLRNVSPPFNAIKILLEHMKHPLSRHQIVRILVAKGARLGAQAEKSVNQSITTNVRLKKLKEPKFKPRARKQDPANLVGLPEWKESLFKS